MSDDHKAPVSLMHKMFEAAVEAAMPRTCVPPYLPAAPGGGKLVDVVASGISEALITTEMGLLIAVPGYFMAYAIKRRKDEYEAFLVRLESLTLQQFKRKAVAS